jgi:sulfate adenylyltransferase subunit 2
MPGLGPAQSLYNGPIRKGEHERVLPISRWTLENLEVPSIHFAHEREVLARDGTVCCR